MLICTIKLSLFLSTCSELKYIHLSWSKLSVWIDLEKCASYCTLVQNITCTLVATCMILWSVDCRFFFFFEASIIHISATYSITKYLCFGA